MTDTTNPTAKYSKNYSGDVGETPKSMAGTWHLEAPDGRRWAGSCPINCVAQELAERVPVQVQLARMLAIVAEPDLDERHATLGVEYGTGKVDDLVDKLHAEITELRAKLEALEKQRPCGYLPYGYVGRSAMVFGQPVPESVPIYLAAGARPMGEVPALPNGWVPCIISFDGDQEEVAYGPQVMMDRLSKWLGKHFERVRAEKAATTR